MIPAEEFERAFAQAQEKYPKISRDLGRAFIETLNDRRRNDRSTHFPELIRLTLNGLKIWSSEARAPYRALAGFFFGRRGGRVAAMRRKAHTAGTNTKRPRAAKRRGRRVRIIAEKDGQLAWQL